MVLTLEALDVLNEALAYELRSVMIMMDVGKIHFIEFLWLIGRPLV